MFCYPQNVEIDGPDGLSGPAPKLVEKTGSKFRVRHYQERGGSETLGIGEAGAPGTRSSTSFIGCCGFSTNRPDSLQKFLDTARPNQEQLRLVTQALCAPVLGRSDALDSTPTAELSALSRLNANWPQHHRRRRICAGNRVPGPRDNKRWLWR